MRVFLATEEDRTLLELRSATTLPQRVNDRTEAVQINFRGWYVEKIAAHFDWYVDTVRDDPGTAQAIARQIGLLQMGAIMTGAELDHMSDVELQERIQCTNIFARAVPEQKLRLVNALEVPPLISASKAYDRPMLPCAG